MCHPEVPEGQETPLVTREEVSIPLPGGEALPAMLAYPDSGAGPAILLATDIFGRSPFYEHLAARLATAGFVALLPDLFFREGPLADRTSRDEALARKARVDEHRTLRDLGLTIDWLQARPEVAGDRVGTIGFCFGGTLVLDLAAAGRDLATVCYYGFPAGEPQPDPSDAPAPLTLVDQIRGPILAFWGDQDTGVGIPNVERFAAELQRRQVDFEHTIYPGLGHGFMARSGLDPAHPAYQLACDAWTRTIEFYRQRLGAVPVAGPA